METCLSDLKHLAPTAALTKEALSLGRESASFGTWLLRALLALTFAGTLAHAWLRRRSRLPEPAVAGSVATAPLVLLCLLSLAPASATRAETAPAPSAASKAAATPRSRTAASPASTEKHVPTELTKRESLSRFKIDDADPEGSLPDAQTLANGP